MTATWATVLTAALAAVAAAASWASVWQSRKQIRLGVEPDLQILIEGGKGSDHLGLQIRNTGGGTAKRIIVMGTIADDRMLLASIGVGYMPPGYGLRVDIHYQGAAQLDDGDVAFILISSDTREFAHGWSHLAKHKVFRSRFLRRHREVTAKEVFAHFFPDIDQTGREAVSFEWTQVPPGGMLDQSPA